MSACCDEPNCRRKAPIGIYLADFSGRAYAVTRRRLVSVRHDRSATFAASERHDVTQAVERFIRSNRSWVMDVLDREEP